MFTTKTSRRKVICHEPSARTGHGVLLTIGTAFIADAFIAGEVTSETCSKQIVNWDVAKERLHDSTASIQTGWDRLKNGLRSLE